MIELQFSRCLYQDHDGHVYLGLVFNEFHDLAQTAKSVAASASRALGLIISKFYANGGMPYKVFTKVYESLVAPVIDYGAAIWGKRYSVYSLVSTEVLTRPSSPSRHCTYRNHFNPPGDIPEQLAAYSAHTLSTALFMLGTHFAAG